MWGEIYQIVPEFSNLIAIIFIPHLVKISRFIINVDILCNMSDHFVFVI